MTDLGELERPFRSLPERWQRILYLTCILDLPLAAVASAMGLTVGAATALAARARKGLRAAAGPAVAPARGLPKPTESSRSPPECPPRRACAAAMSSG
ncbi:sigma factor-like helix-turn-helix DNA-binding protein [Leifsonia xyli]|uniref:sigma factor-like helix-turn-helix DNA-binding protein n=1 Tax=Leifsonia xyli TaxID=1575 RepID=UPI003D666C89